MKIGKQNMNLHHRIFLLLLAVGLASFIIAGAVSLAGMYAIRENIDKTGALLADNTASFTESFAEEQVKKRLSSDAAGKAQLIRHEMQTTMDDTRYLADRMTKMLKNPEYFKRRRLPDPQHDVIPSGKAYVNFSREMERQYGAGAFAGEIGLVSNIADDLELMPEWYTAAFVGSVHGYLIAMDVTPDNSAKQFSQAFLESYDPRKMGWYRLAADGNKSGFTGLYTDSNGNRCLTCVAPYYDAAGLAGVVGIDCNPETLFRLTDNAGAGDKDDLDQDAIKAEQPRFLLDNATGSVIFSTFLEGPLAVPQSATDLRQSPEKSIARAASAMVAGQKDVMLITLGGEDYFLAFAPVEKPGWSYGVLNHKRAVVYPAAYARDNVISQMEGFAETLHDSFRARVRWGLVTFLLMLVPLFFISSVIAKRFVTPILALIDGVKRIAQGDLDEKVTARWAFEQNQIAYPWDYDALPEVHTVPAADLFDCDVVVFVASKGIPPVGSGVKDVRMYQFENNRKIVSMYARQAREKNFGGMFCQVSDPVDPLAKTMFLESNRNADGVLDWKGLRAEQIQGFGLGVMNARAAYYAKRDPRFASFLTEGRTFGPHGEELVVANSVEHYDDVLSAELTHRVVTANLEMRALGFKPFVAPAFSSGALSILLMRRGEWHCGSVYLGGAFRGVKNRYTPYGLETEILPLPEALSARIRAAEEKLKSVI